MIDPGILATVASIIAGFGTAMLFFRIQRELFMAEKSENILIAYSYYLLIVATLISLILVILPIISLSSPSLLWVKLSAAACSAAIIMIVGYIFGILAHYRLVFSGGRTGPRHNPEPAERVVVWMAIISSIVIFIAIMFNN